MRISFVSCVIFGTWPRFSFFVNNKKVENCHNALKQTFLQKRSDAASQKNMLSHAAQSFSVKWVSIYYDVIHYRRHMALVDVSQNLKRGGEPCLHAIWMQIVGSIVVAFVTLETMLPPAILDLNGTVLCVSPCIENEMVSRGDDA